MTKIMIWRGSKDLRQIEWPPEVVNGVLEGKLKLVLDDITITEVYAETQIFADGDIYDWYDWKVPDAALKEFGFEPYNKEGH